MAPSATESSSDVKFNNCVSDVIANAIISYGPGLPAQRVCAIGSEQARAAPIPDGPEDPVRAEFLRVLRDPTTKVADVIRKQCNGNDTCMSGIASDAVLNYGAKVSATDPPLCTIGHTTTPRWPLFTMDPVLNEVWRTLQDSSTLVHAAITTQCRATASQSSEGR